MTMSRMSDTASAPPSNAPSSFNSEVYVTQTAQLLGLAIPPEQMAGVVAQFDRLQTIAQPVLDFPLPDTLEAAPTFDPCI